VILASEADARRWFVEGLGCDREAVDRLSRFEAMLAEENSRQNLVSAKSLSEIWVRHFADSAQLLTVSRGTPTTWLDLGSGAGFPGLVIAICRPDLQVTLVESRRKRVEWLETASAALQLQNVVIAGTSLAAVPSSSFDVISARAFAPLAQIVAISARFSTPETQWLLPKGRSGAQELAAMPKSIQTMFHVERSMTDMDAVILVGCGVPPKVALK
jgi:16S rRNA (guanine527-N7)-methyltransferase